MGMAAESDLDVLRDIMKKVPKPWVVFKNLSVVAIDKPSADVSLEEDTTNIMKSMGPVIPGTPHGDFNVVKVEDKGWLVTSHCSSLITFVPVSEFHAEDLNDLNDMTIGLLGRGKRHLDSQNPEIIHVEQEAQEGQTKTE